MRSKSILAAACTLALVAASAPPAGAISDGTPDVEHPNVGALLAEVEPGVFEIWCSGALLSPRHFVTAAHCLADGLPPGALSVTFDQDALTAPERLAVTGYRLHPRAFESRSEPLDIGVVTLGTPVAGIAPVDLPPERFLSQEAAQGGLRGHYFVNVGYGWVPNDRGQPGGTPPRLRLRSTSLFSALTHDYLGLLERTEATGAGGSCYGDSGSPKLYEPVPGPRSNLAVAILTGGGDRWCRAKSYSQRLDVPAVRSFLDDFVAVP